MAPSALVGAIINGKYRVDAVIAEGGMGIVYEGWHAALERRVAIKVMRGELNDNTEAVRRFLNEARALARLRGPHQAQVLDVGRIQNGPAYMVLEFLEGGDLRSLLDREGALPIPRAVDLVMQACDSVGEAHAVGIVHRDLKPENFLLTQAFGAGEIVKLIDFGISKRLDAPPQRHLTLDGESLGSPHYMSPEQMSSPKLTDGRADIWSLGVLLFELLTNRMPFEGETVAVVFAQVLSGTPQRLRTFLPEAPEELERVIDTCLQIDRDRRFQTTEELRSALAPFGSAANAAQRFGRSHTPVPVSPRAPWSEPPTQDRFTPVPRVHLTTHSEIVRPQRRRRRAVTLTLAGAALAGACVYSVSNTLRESASPRLRVAQDVAYDAYASTAHNVRRLVTRAQGALVAHVAAASASEPTTSDTPALDGVCVENERASGSSAVKCRPAQGVPAPVIFAPGKK